MSDVIVDTSALVAFFVQSEKCQTHPADGWPGDSLRPITV
jgi:hypothetical protein